MIDRSTSNALVVYVGEGSSTSSSDDSGQKKKWFVGLSNQGATCYMNSLLQTLYMTPEFRRALYKWRYNANKDGAEELCIPLQLQKLFGLLQLSDSRAVDTRALTKSFGWEGSEVFQQQDVQELCRILFDALEESFKGTEVENVIDDLYAGQHIDYVKCVDVDYQAERRDKFLDFSLAIQEFGSNTTMKSLTEAIEHYLQPEILDGDNRYFAESVGRKVDAIKGLKFCKLPTILSVHLKRFVFDFSGDNIVQKKINDQVSFPILLDMNKYVSRKSYRAYLASLSSAGSTAVGESKGEDLQAELADEFEDFLGKKIASLRAKRASSNGGDGEGLDAHAAYATSSKVSAMEFDPSLPDLVDCNGNLCPDQIEENSQAKLLTQMPTTPPPPLPTDAQELLRTRGEWVYELFAVLVHAGAIGGGHYYVYIKDQDTGKWWNFNDSSVSEISEQRVLEAWGGSSTYTNYYGTKVTTPNNANAYMLMYRKAKPTSDDDRERSRYPDDTLVPPYIKDDLERLAAEARLKQIADEERMSGLILKIHWESKEHTINAKRYSTLRQVMQIIWNELKLAEHALFKRDPKDGSDDIELEAMIPFPQNQLRLRVYNSYTKAAQEPYSVEMSGDMTMDLLRIYSYRELFLEYKSPLEPWPAYDPQAFNISLFEYDTVTLTFKDPKVTRIHRHATLGELRAIVEKSIDETSPYFSRKIRFLKLTNWTQSEVRCEELNGDHYRLIADLRIFEGQKIYWEEDIGGAITQSPAFAAYSELTNKMQIWVNPIEDPKMFNISLTVDRRWNLTILREHIAKRLNISANSFRIFRRSAIDMELNADIVSTLFGIGIQPGTYLLLQDGSPLALGHYIFKIHWYKPKLKPYVHNIEDLDVNAYLSNTRPESITPPPASDISDLQDVVLDDEAVAATPLLPSEADIANEELVVTATVALAEASVCVLDEVMQATPVLTSADFGLLETSLSTVPVSQPDHPDHCTFGYLMIDMNIAKEQFEFLLDMDVESITATLDIKRVILQTFKDKSLLPEEDLARLNEDLLRLRHKSKLRVSAFLHDGTLRENEVAMYSNRELAVEILETPQVLPSLRLGDVVVMARRWLRSSWTLGDTVEVLLRANMKVKDIAVRLAVLFGIKSFKDVRVLIVTPYSEIRICDLASKVQQTMRTWMDPMLEDRTLSSMVWHLNEGDLILIQDESEPLRDLTEAEKKSVEEARVHMSSDATYSVYYDYPSSSSSPTKTGSMSSKVAMPHREQGIHIKTHQKREKERLNSVQDGSGGSGADTSPLSEGSNAETKQPPSDGVSSSGPQIATGESEIA